MERRLKDTEMLFNLLFLGGTLKKKPHIDIVSAYFVFRILNYDKSCKTDMTYIRHCFMKKVTYYYG